MLLNSPAEHIPGFEYRATTANPCACTTITMLILIGIPTLLGFSERTLIFFEQRLFGKAGLPRARSNRRKL
jgi:NADH:ubiquinone oxidoreductase subunit 2 (subunit N)